MKIREIEPKVLGEGFISNIVQRIKAASGPDGVSIARFISDLAAVPSAKDTLAKAISREITTSIRDQLGDAVNDINSGDAPAPIELVYKEAQHAGARLATRDGESVTAADIINTVNTQESDVLKLIGTTNNQYVKAIYLALNGLPAPSLAIGIDNIITIVSSIVAGAILIASFKNTATKRTQNQAAFEINAADNAKFDQVGQQIFTILFDPNSIRALQPNQKFKDNMEGLIATFANQFKTWAGLSTIELAKIVHAKPTVINSTELTSALSSHSNQTDLQIVNKLASELVTIFKELSDTFLNAALKETKVKGTAANSWLTMVRPWGIKAFDYIGRIANKQQPVKQAKGTSVADDGKFSEPVSLPGQAAYVKNTDGVWVSAKDKTSLAQKDLIKMLDQVLAAHGK